MESKYTGNFCAYTDNPPTIIKYRFPPLSSRHLIPYCKKQKSSENTVQDTRLHKKMLEWLFVKKKYPSLSGKKEQQEGETSLRKSRKLKASYLRANWEDPFSLYEEENFFPLRELFKSERKRTIDKRILSSSGNYSQHANKESNGLRRLKSLPLSLSLSLCLRVCRAWTTVVPDV